MDLFAGVPGDVVAVQLGKSSQGVILGEANVGDEAAGLQEDGFFDEFMLIRNEIFLVRPETSAESEDAGRSAVVGRVELANAFPDGLLNGGLESLRLAELVDCSEFGQEKVHCGQQRNRKQALPGGLHVKGHDCHWCVGEGNVFDLPGVKSEFAIEEAQMLV